jgi:hypothetical protein
MKEEKHRMVQLVIRTEKKYASVTGMNTKVDGHIFLDV